MFAAGKGHIKIVKKLLGRGGNVRHKNYWVGRNFLLICWGFVNVY